MSLETTFQGFVQYIKQTVDYILEKISERKLLGSKTNLSLKVIIINFISKRKKLCILMCVYMQTFQKYIKQHNITLFSWHISTNKYIIKHYQMLISSSVFLYFSLHSFSTKSVSKIFLHYINKGLRYVQSGMNFSEIKQKLILISKDLLELTSKSKAKIRK